MKTHEGIRIGPAWVHRLEQWDLNTWPFVCVHWRTPNRSKRVFCLWKWGIQVGSFRLSTRAISLGRKSHKW